MRNDNPRPQIVISHNVAYFGTVIKSKTAHEVINAIKLGSNSISSEDIRKWYSKAETNDLISVEIQGNAQMAIHNLESKLETYYDICYKLMQDARSAAVPELVVRNFDELCKSI